MIRRADKTDIPTITTLFRETIVHINSKDYPPDEIEDWSSWHANIGRWEEKVRDQYFIVAIMEGEIVGFASLADDGYLDFMFVHKDYQGRGIAREMLEELEIKALKNGNSMIYSDVSITARRFFERSGFVIEKQQLKKSKKKELINFRMRKKISVHE